MNKNHGIALGSIFVPSMIVLSTPQPSFSSWIRWQLMYDIHSSADIMMKENISFFFEATNNGIFDFDSNFEI